MNKIIVLALSIIFCFAFCSCNLSNSQDEVIKIGDEVICQAEVRFMMAESVDALREEMKSKTDYEKNAYWNSDINGKKPIDIIREDATENLIKYSVIAKAARNADISLSADEVDNRINILYSSSDINTLRKEYGVSKSDIRKVIKKQILYEHYIYRVLKNEAGFNPENEKLLEYFHKNYLKAQIISVSTKNKETNLPFGEEELEKAKERADRLYRRAENGEKFTELMLEETDDEGAFISPDGYVFTEGQVADEVFDAVKKLSVDEISEPVTSSYGYHIIKRVPLFDGDLLDMEQNVLNRYQNDYINSFVSEKKNEYKIEKNDAKLNNITVNTEN